MVVVLLTGRLESLQTVSIIAAFPFMLLTILIAVSLYRDLSQELAMKAETDRLLKKRIERLLLREDEREAARQAEEEVQGLRENDESRGVSRVSSISKTEEYRRFRNFPKSTNTICGHPLII